MQGLSRKEQCASSSEDDVQLTDLKALRAKKWVRHQKINKKVDRTEDDYVERVKLLLSAGSSQRRMLRAMKGQRKDQDACYAGPTLDVEQVCLQARLYYEEEFGRLDKRPRKILKHTDYPTLGRHYLLLWSDRGYAGQDIEEWKPADYAKKFEGLVENYYLVSRPCLSAFCASMCLGIPSFYMQCHVSYDDSKPWAFRSCSCRKGNLK